MKTKPEPTEHAEQSTVMQWAAYHSGRWPVLKLLHAIPNGAFFGAGVKELKSGKQVPLAAIRANRLKSEGLREGVPDLCLPVPSGSHHGLYIEMKRQRSGRTSSEQEWWGQALQALGYHWVCCHGADLAIAALKNYLARVPPLSPETQQRLQSTPASTVRTPARRAPKRPPPPPRRLLLPPA